MYIYIYNIVTMGLSWYHHDSTMIYIYIDTIMEHDTLGLVFSDISHITILRGNYVYIPSIHRRSGLLGKGICRNPR